MIKIGYSHFDREPTQEQFNEYAIVLWMIDQYYQEFNNLNVTIDPSYDIHGMNLLSKFKYKVESILNEEHFIIHMPYSIVQALIDKGIKVNPMFHKNNALYHIMTCSDW